MHLHSILQIGIRLCISGFNECVFLCPLEESQLLLPLNGAYTGVIISGSGTSTEVAQMHFDWILVRAA